MDAVANPAYAPYRSDYRADRCPNPAVLPADENWIYPQFHIPAQAAYSTRVQLPSMYPVQRPDQSYPSPSPSVPSPGPRLPSQLEYSATTPPSADFSPRDSHLGPVRNLRARQLSLSYKHHGRKHSVSDSQLGEYDQDDLSESRPQTPHDGCHPGLMHPGAGLSLSIPSGMDPTVQLQSPYQPTTPASLYSPVPYASYAPHLDGRPPSPALSIRTSGSGNQYHFSADPLPSHGKPPSRVKKHTKKKLDALDKKRICMYHLDHQNARQEDIAEMFGIERSTVSKILKNKNQWLNVDDNAETHSKNRPSKFPELEEVMRKFLQECIDRDTSITDSLIRTRALEVAKTLFISEEKFKASSGWIENFKHRHGIRSGKWCQGVKSAPACQNPNPGLNGSSSSSLPHSSSSYHHIPGSSSSESLIDSPTYDKSTHGDHGRSCLRVDDQEDWSTTPSHRIHVSAGSSASILHHQDSLISPDPSDDNGDPRGYELTHALVYHPLSDLPRQPTIHDAEDAINTLISYIDNADQQIIEDHERRTLSTVKCALFQFVNGVPFSRS